MLAVEIGADPVFSAGIPTLLFEGRFQRSSAARANYDVSPDGERFVMVQEGPANAGAGHIIVVQNWFEELKRLVPTN